MRRRGYLATAGGALLATAGCVQLQHVRSVLGIDRLDPQTEPDEPVTLQGTKDDGSWPQVAHDARNSRYAPGATPPQEDPAVAWRALGDRSVYPPVADDDVYTTERWTDGTALALDSEDGSTRWKNRELPPMRWPPAIDDDHLFVITRSGGNEIQLRALATEDGAERWSQEGLTATTHDRFVAPTIERGTVYVPSNTGVIALDAETGEQWWSVKLAEHIRDGRATSWAKPAVTEGYVYTFDRNQGDGELSIYAIEKVTGTRAWTAEIDLPRSWHLRRSWIPNSSSVVAGREYVFVSASEGEERIANQEASTTPSRLYAIEVESGEVAWLWELKGSLAPLAYAEGYLFVAAWDHDAERATLRALNVEAETVAWTYETEIGDIGVPTVTPETVYFRQGPELAAISIEDGSLMWRLSMEADLQAFEYARDMLRVSDPIVTTETIYLRTGGFGGDTVENRILAVQSS